MIGALLAAVICGLQPGELLAQTQNSGVLLYDPVPMDSADPYAIQPNGYFTPVQPLAPIRNGFRLISNPVPYRGRMFFRGEYLGWMLDPMNTPALVTTSPTGTAQAQSGVLGNPLTRTLFGGEINDDFRQGFRVQGGWYVDPTRYWGIGGDYYQVFSGGDTFNASSADYDILARPFFDIIAGRERANLVSYPAVVDGELGIDTETKLQSFGIHIQADALNKPGAVTQIASDCAREPRLDWILGYRNVRLEDRIAFTENLVSLLPPPNAGTLNLRESFATENAFQGIEIGAVREIPFGRFWFETVSKVALGTNAQTVTIAGSTVLTEAGVPETYPGGLLTQRSNIGSYERNEFCLVQNWVQRLVFMSRHDSA